MCFEGYNIEYFMSPALSVMSFHPAIISYKLGISLRTILCDTREWVDYYNLINSLSSNSLAVDTSIKSLHVYLEVNRSLKNIYT